MALVQVAQYKVDEAQRGLRCSTAHRDVERLHHGGPPQVTLMPGMLLRMLALLPLWSAIRRCSRAARATGRRPHAARMLRVDRMLPAPALLGRFSGATGAASRRWGAGGRRAIRWRVRKTRRRGGRSACLGGAARGAGEVQSSFAALPATQVRIATRAERL